MNQAEKDAAALRVIQAAVNNPKLNNHEVVGYVSIVLKKAGYEVDY